MAHRLIASVAGVACGDDEARFASSEDRWRNVDIL